MPFLAEITTKTPDQNFGIAIMFKIVKKLKNYASSDDKTVSAPGASIIRYISCPLFTYRIDY